MKNAINTLYQGLESHLKTLACCCGHGKYPMTIVLKNKSTGMIFELFSDKIILREKKFYKKDKQEFYYIPEVVKNGNK